MRFRVITVVLLAIALLPSFQVSGLVPWGEVDHTGGFMVEKQGFRYIQVRGTPDQIGYQHGTMLHDLVERSIAAYAHATERSDGLSWSQVRVHGRSYWRYVPAEQRTEIEAIARGASDMGARNPIGDPVDWVDILALNAIWDIWWRVSPPGNPFWWLPGSTYVPTEVESPHHCSAFVATGEATVDGGFVMGQSLWMPYFLSPAHAVFMDVIPDTGNRFIMEVTAGMIWSGTEWYQNSAGLTIAETTLGTGPYIWGGTPSFVRLRKAVQYADSIDSFKDIMLEETNGAYCGDYLLADAKTNEVAILELGAYEWALKRTKSGFLQSCNYPWDEAVAKEMGAPQGWDHGCYPRWVRWEQLRDRDYGNITVQHGMEYLGDHYDTVEDRINPCSHTLCGHVENASGYPHGSLDAKVTNRTMAFRMETFCRFGHSCGQPFIVADHAREHPEYAFDDLVDIIPKPFATFSIFSTITIAVSDRDGEPVAGARVNMTSLLDGHSFEAVTDANGDLYLEYVPSSSYRVRAWKGDRTCTSTIDLHESGSLNMEIVEGPRTTLEKVGSGGILLIVAFLVAAIVLAYVWYRRSRSR